VYGLVSLVLLIILDDIERIDLYILGFEIVRYTGYIAKGLRYAFPRDFLRVSGVRVFDSDIIGVETPLVVTQAHELGA
jgi:hypothetical protein